ncbi:hypothetical protein [Polyangium fumosum]|uniref:ATP-binding protein n=1 Tax=Polyangium fumosum TaxID=889272 RepID=A0A4U1IZ51_9BACT|nr:hypothetical protein [Polyangium fumosum]TKC99888.1 hypothetical protein E8A74_36355 [Polyangium fumosum]
MDWERFDTHGEDKRETFEAFVCQLFEQLCRREYGRDLLQVRLVNGDGGDGGVEAYALVRKAGASEPDVVGVQAKWFPNSLTDTQVKQIDKSFQAARQNHPRLVRYLVALPRKLGDKRRGTRRSERDRWDAWVAEAKRRASGTRVELWDGGRLERELAEPENEGIHAYWFRGSVFTWADLDQHFRRAKDGWLRLRYLPHLHTRMELERDLDLRMGSAVARQVLLVNLGGALDDLRQTQLLVAHLPRYPGWRQRGDALEELRASLAALDGLENAGRTLALAVRQGQPILSDWPVDLERTYRALQTLQRALQDLDQKRYSPTQYILKQLSRSLERSTADRLREFWNEWQQARRFVAYVGPPGTGKTHGLTHAVEHHMKAGRPALLLRGRDCTIEKGLAEILRDALDRPNASLREILAAMQATAIRADVRRAHAATASSSEGELEREPTCFLLAIDGIEETGHHRRWAEVLRDLATDLPEHPRLRVAVTLRSTSAEAILGQVRRDRYARVDLRAHEQEVGQLLETYCHFYHLPLPDRRLRWALREPLSVRLYCDLKREDPAWGADRRSLSLPRLLAEKLDLAEDAIRDTCGFGPHQAPLRAALQVITKATLARGRIPYEEAVQLASAALPSMDSKMWSSVLDQAASHGLLLIEDFRHDPLAPTCTYVEPAYDPLTDHFVARAVCAGLESSLTNPHRAVPRGISALLRRRPDAATQAAILLADEGVSLIESGVFQDVFSTEEVERLELRAIAAINEVSAQRYRPWVLERLTASMPSCRRVLKELTIPVARDPEHPFGPRFIHEALLPFLPARRDLFWSGPSALPGDTEQPWEGFGDEALEDLDLRPDDPADGPPLLLGWSLTSLDNRFRRRARAKLANWGSRDICALVRWLDLVNASNDPQMIEDVAMIAYGATILAKTDPNIEQVVNWVDVHWLARTDVPQQVDLIVLHAARGIVERARIMGQSIASTSLVRAQHIYGNIPCEIRMDEQAARLADDHDGISPIIGDLAWYTVPRAIDAFFRNRHVGPGGHDASEMVPNATHLLAAHATRAGLPNLSPQRFAFGVLAAYLQAQGIETQRNDDERRSAGVSDIDRAILQRYRSATHGARSAVSTTLEKYVWTGCYALQALLAAHVPGRRGHRPYKTHPDPTYVSDLEPNPIIDIVGALPAGSWSQFSEGDLATPIPSSLESHRERANDWIRRATKPNVQPWILLPRHRTPDWARDSEWVTLFCCVTAIEPDSRTESTLRIGSAITSSATTTALRTDKALGLRLHRHDLCEFVESVACRTYIHPMEAIWAPWADGREGTISEQTEHAAKVDLRATTAHGTYLRTSASDPFGKLNGEFELYMPAFWLRRALELVDAIPTVDGAEWRFKDRQRRTLAVYIDQREPSGERSEALLVRRDSLEEALSRTDTKVVWGGWLHREPSLGLMDSADPARPFMEREWRWLGFMANGLPQIIDLLDVCGNEVLQPEPPPPPAPPTIPIGPTNPDLAIPLTTDLDRDDAIPYFLWDDPIPVRELRHRLATAPQREQDRLLGKILREARDTDVWKFTTPDDVAHRWSALKRHLGRRRPFWEFLLNRWHVEGLLAEKPA